MGDAGLDVRSGWGWELGGEPCVEQEERRLYPRHRPRPTRVELRWPGRGADASLPGSLLNIGLGGACVVAAGQPKRSVVMLALVDRPHSGVMESTVRAAREAGGGLYLLHLAFVEPASDRFYWDAIFGVPSED